MVADEARGSVVIAAGLFAVGYGFAVTVTAIIPSRDPTSPDPHTPKPSSKHRSHGTRHSHGGHHLDNVALAHRRHGSTATGDSQYIEGGHIGYHPRRRATATPPRRRSTRHSSRRRYARKPGFGFASGRAHPRAALALLNDQVKKGGVMASSYVGGLSGAFIPVSEDQGMIDAVNAGALSICHGPALICWRRLACSVCGLRESCEKDGEGDGCAVIPEQSSTQGEGGAPLSTAQHGALHRCAQLAAMRTTHHLRRRCREESGWLRSGRVWGARWVSRCGQAANPMRGPPCMCKPRFGAAMPLIVARRGL